jgi:Uma2 family endonuclease
MIAANVSQKETGVQKPAYSPAGPFIIAVKDRIMASTTTRLMSFEEFEKLPDSRDVRQELHHGELIEVPPPKQGHKLIERRLRRLFENAGGGSGEAEIEVGFRPCPGNEYWIADVVFVSRDRWDAIPDDGYMQGAPDLVVEILSPSNSAAEMRDKRKICLENGCREFWVVDPKLREVEVSTPDGHTITFQPGQQVPLFFGAGSSLGVDSIFE